LSPGQSRDSHGTVTQGHATEREEDIDKNKNKNIDTEKETEDKVPYQKVLDMYHGICVSFPKIRALSEERKKHIKARYRQYQGDINVFKELFFKAEASDFLKGNNDRKWKATLDWMMNETNMIKILEGKYENKKKPDPQGPGFDPYEIKRY